MSDIKTSSAETFKAGNTEVTVICETFDTVRDRFAINAMNAFIIRGDYNITNDEIAVKSYAVAEAMMKCKGLSVSGIQDLHFYESRKVKND